MTESTVILMTSGINMSRSEHRPAHRIPKTNIVLLPFVMLQRIPALLFVLVLFF